MRIRRVSRVYQSRQRNSGFVEYSAAAAWVFRGHPDAARAANPGNRGSFPSISRDHKTSHFSIRSRIPDDECKDLLSPSRHLADHASGWPKDEIPLHSKTSDLGAGARPGSGSISPHARAAPGIDQHFVALADRPP